MLHLTSGSGFELFGYQLLFVQILSSAAARGNEPEEVFAIFLLIALLNTKMDSIAEHLVLVNMERLTRRHNIVDVIPEWRCGRSSYYSPNTCLFP